ncbi:MAG: glutamine synthetase family protein [Rubrivivax sp.]
MTCFARRCGVHDAEREAAVRAVLERARESGVDLVRIGWCDVHGLLRGKTVVASALERALQDGIGLVSTLMLKDTSDRTALPVFEPGGTASLPGFGQANNLVLLPDPASFCTLPWAPGNGWLRAEPWFDDGTPVALDTRRVLQRALARLADAGYTMQCGLEVEFHVYRLKDLSPHTDPQLAGWPGPAPAVELLHPGYALLAETGFDAAEDALRIVQRTSQGLGLPLASLEVEFGPSQVEAVFDATDALTAADNMVRFRNGVKMALRRAGYHATFVCRPPFPNIMSSGWHLHQSLLRRADGRNAFVRDKPAPGSGPLDAAHTLSDLGEHYLAGLLAHARSMAVFCTPTVNGYARFRPNALAPQSVLWGRDNRGAMLRVLGGNNDPATRIENRLGEPAANPYLYIAAQVFAGLDGIERGLRAPRATESPYGSEAKRLPSGLGDALAAMREDSVMVQGVGPALAEVFTRIKQSEIKRHAEATDGDEFMRREYFGRI